MIKVNVWQLALGAALGAAMCLFVGFLWGTEWQKTSSLQVGEYALPGLLIDQAIFERAWDEEQAKSDANPIAIFHLETTLVNIKADITKARGGQ